MTVERNAWDRREGESTRAYEGFRTFRDAGPLRTLPVVHSAHPRTVEGWSRRWDWHARAAAWDDATHMLDDARRLEAIRTMHDTHQRAGRAAIQKALAALANARPEDIPAAAAAKLLELGARLERSTILVSVEELQGISTGPELADDPWERIARELEGTA